MDLVTKYNERCPATRINEVVCCIQELWTKTNEYYVPVDIYNDLIKLFEKHQEEFNEYAITRDYPPYDMDYFFLDTLILPAR